MSLLRAGLYRLLAVVLVLSFFYSVATAACTEFDNVTIKDLDALKIQEVQLGLRTAYRDPNPALADGRLGVYTRSKLRELCERVTRPAGMNSVSSTLEVVSEYADIQRNLRNWSDLLFDLDLTARGNVDEQSALGLRLASTTAMKTLAMEGVR